MEISPAQRFTETRILRLYATKPAKVSDLAQAVEILSEMKEFRSYLMARCPIMGYKYNGWDSFENQKVYVMPSSRITKFDLLIEDLEERIIQLKAETKKKDEALQRSSQTINTSAKEDHDQELAGVLWHALEISPPTLGYIYFKVWAMPDGTCWYKIGITNNPERREIEQNVLPVAAVTISCIDVGSMDRARAIEGVIHRVLDEQRITNANNRELFHLSVQQADAVEAVLERLANHSKNAEGSIE